MSLSDFKIEIILILVSVGLLLDFLLKTAKVKKSVDLFSIKLQEYLSLEFSLVKNVIKNSPHEFYIYSSGRTGLDSCLITLSYAQKSLLPPVKSVSKDTLRVKGILFI